MGDSEHINETVETIDMSIVSELNNEKKKARNDLMKQTSETLSLSIDFLSKSGIIFNKPLGGKKQLQLNKSLQHQLLYKIFLHRLRQLQTNPVYFLKVMTISQLSKLKT